MKRQKFQWLLSGLIILVAIAIGVAIYSTYTPAHTSSVSTKIVKQRYRTWEKDYLRGNSQQKFVKTNSGTTDQTLSEAQGYGMLITVMAAKQGFGSQKTFDQLTRYYLNHQISSQNPLMAWRQTGQGIAMVSNKAEKTSATDGDLDIAYALILADEQWGSSGKIKYNKLAKKLLKSIKKHEINSTTKLPKVGDWAINSDSSKLVRTSDLMTAYFRKFARFTGDGSWIIVAQNSQKTLRNLSNQEKTGLMSDFVTVSGSRLKTGHVKANQVASKYDNQYGFNACRIPWRVAYDYQLNRSRTSKQVLLKMNKFFMAKDKITAVYDLDGKAVESYSNEAFSAPVAYAAEVVGNRTLKNRYQKSLTSELPVQNYYPATVQMAVMLAASNKA